MISEPINFDTTILKTEQDFEWYLLTNLQPVTEECPDMIDINGEFYDNILKFTKDKRPYRVYRHYSSGKIVLKISEIFFSKYDSFSDFLKYTSVFFKNKNQ